MSEESSQPQHLAFQWSAMTHIGRFRKNNEDAFIIVACDAQQVKYLGKQGEANFDNGDVIFAVSDGMGGANAGEFASRIVVQKIAELMPKGFRLGVEGFQRGGIDFLEELFQRIHKDMVYNGQHYEECRGMGATLTLCWLTPDRAYFGHIGDSRLYYIPAGGEIRQVSQDHTHVGWLRREGKLSELQARMHPAKNQLQKSLGGRSRSAEPQVGTLKLEPGDCLMLCTDGVSDEFSERVMDSIIRTPGPRLKDLPPAERLIKEALDGTGRDNLTAMVIEFKTHCDEPQMT